MIVLIMQSLYLMLPAFFANMMPVFVRNIPFLNFPLDFNKKYKGKPILGTHKTFRGLFFGVLASLIVAFVQYDLMVYPLFESLSILDYNNWFVIGILLGFGAIFGDSFKSFFKRRFGIKEGKSFIPWDQIDYSIGALAFISILKFPGIYISIYVVIFSFLLHIFVNIIGYHLGIRSSKI